MKIQRGLYLFLCLHLVHAQSIITLPRGVLEEGCRTRLSQIESIGILIEAVLDDEVLFESIGVLIEAVLDDEVLFGVLEVAVLDDEVLFCVLIEAVLDDEVVFKFKLPVLHDDVSKSCKDKPSFP